MSNPIQILICKYITFRIYKEKKKRRMRHNYRGMKWYDENLGIELRTKAKTEIIFMCLPSKRIIFIAFLNFHVPHACSLSNDESVSSMKHSSLSSPIRRAYTFPASAASSPPTTSTVFCSRRPPRRTALQPSGDGIGCHGSQCPSCWHSRDQHNGHIYLISSHQPSFSAYVPFSTQLLCCGGDGAEVLVLVLVFFF